MSSCGILHPHPHLRTVLFKLYQSDSKMVGVIQVFQVFLSQNLLCIGQAFATKGEFNMLIKKAF